MIFNIGLFEEYAAMLQSYTGLFNIKKKKKKQYNKSTTRKQNHCKQISTKYMTYMTW